MSSSNDHAIAEGASSSSNQSDYLNLRVTYLHAGNPRPPHNVGAIAASTTIGQLKSKLEADLLEHPRPEEQRLIYQGRPLMQNDATLRDALRIEGPIGPPTIYHSYHRPSSTSFISFSTYTTWANGSAKSCPEYDTFDRSARLSRSATGPSSSTRASTACPSHGSHSAQSTTADFGPVWQLESDDGSESWSNAPELQCDNSDQWSACQSTS